MTNDYVGKCYWFLGGALAGAAAALLLAPQNGRRTRRMIRETAEDAADTVAEAGQELRDRGKRIAKSATQLVDRATHVVSP